MFDMWNSPADDAATFFHRLECNRYERTNRCKDNRGVERLCGIDRRAPPRLHQGIEQAACRFIASARECEDTVGPAILRLVQ